MRKFVTVLLGLTMALGSITLSLAEPQEPGGQQPGANSGENRKGRKGKSKRKGNRGKGKGKRNRNGGGAPTATPTPPPAAAQP